MRGFVRILTEARKAEPVIRWANWLSSFSGARLAEITEADTRDIEDIDGVPVFHIRLDYRGIHQNVKNEGSLRRFPIHSAVIREGFLDYVRSLPPGPLFPTVRMNRDGKRSPEAGDIIMPWLRSIGITDPRKVFHSHRHTFKSLSRGRIEEEIHDYITGHGNGAVGRDYGLYPIPMLAEVIERIPDPTAA
jgi:integrase